MAHPIVSTSRSVVRSKGHCADGYCDKHRVDQYDECPIGERLILTRYYPDRFVHVKTLIVPVLNIRFALQPAQARAKMIPLLMTKAISTAPNRTCYRIAYWGDSVNASRAFQSEPLRRKNAFDYYRTALARAFYINTKADEAGDAALIYFQPPSMPRIRPQKQPMEMPLQYACCFALFRHGRIVRQRRLASNQDPAVIDAFWALATLNRKACGDAHDVCLGPHHEATEPQTGQAGVQRHRLRLVPLGEANIDSLADRRH